MALEQRRGRIALFAILVEHDLGDLVERVDPAAAQAHWGHGFEPFNLQRARATGVSPE